MAVQAELLSMSPNILHIRQRKARSMAGSCISIPNRLFLLLRLLPGNGRRRAMMTSWPWISMNPYQPRISCFDHDDVPALGEAYLYNAVRLILSVLQTHAAELLESAINRRAASIVS